MDLVFRGSAGHPLGKTSSGALQLGRWFWVPVDTTSFRADGTSSTGTYTNMQKNAISEAMGKSAWETRTDFQLDAFLGSDVGYGIGSANAGIQLVSFSPSEKLQGRTIKKVLINVFRGGATVLYWGYSAGPPEEWWPDYADLWDASSVYFSFKFRTSKPSSPSSASFSSPDTNIDAGTLTESAVDAGASIVYDTSGYWTTFNDGFYNVSAPSGVGSTLTGKSKYWLLSYPPSGSSFNPNYTAAGTVQNARCGDINGLWVYA